MREAPIARMHEYIWCTVCMYVQYVCMYVCMYVCHLLTHFPLATATLGFELFNSDSLDVTAAGYQDHRPGG